MKRYLLFFLAVAAFFHAAAQDNFPVKSLGKTIYTGAFTGNGLLGSMTYLKTSNAFRVDIGRTDVYDHRENKESALFDKARLPIGHFEFVLPDSIRQASAEIQYKKGIAVAKIETASGAFRVKTVTFAHRNLIYLEISPLSSGSLLETVNWIPEEAISPRTKFAHAQKPDHYPANPKGSFLEIEGVRVYKQPLLAGGGYATAWKAFRKKDKLLYLISVGYNTGSEDYITEAVAQVNAFRMNKLDDELAKHTRHWTEYYEKSKLLVPDVALQQFYDMQLYKLACATREDRPAMDLQGPWTASTPWPAYWHNLNIQLAYSPVFTANHLEIAKSLKQMIDRNVDNLIGNVPEAYRYNSAAIGRSSAPDMISPVWLERGKDGSTWEDGKKELGNLTWMMHSYYQYYRYSMDPKVYDTLFPLLKRAVNYYLHLLERDEQGKYHVAVRTHSPEYPKSYDYDTNYDLSILKWGLTALISLDEERGGKDALNQQWKDVLFNLREFPQNEDGFMIAKGRPYAESHRHYSHLMMIYPFYLVNWDQEENRELISRSIAHWQSKDRFLQGYSFSGAASMYAMMGKGDEALRSLKVLLNKYVKPNTLYAETGPVIETPLAAMSSIQELCLQYWNGTVRVFPAIPEGWQDVSFEHFRTDGAFLISAERKAGKNVHVRIFSEKDGQIKIKPNLDGRLSWKGTKKGVKLLENQNGIYLFEIPKGATLLLQGN